MPSSFSPAQYLNLAQAWSDWSDALFKFQQGHAGDDSFDNVKAQAWINQANAISSLFANKEMTVTFNNVEDAYNKLLNITQQATKYATDLTAEVQTWNKAAAVADKMITVITALEGGGLLSVPFFSALNGVAKAYTGDPTADATATAP